jgi:hypothetical protein
MLKNSLVSIKIFLLFLLFFFYFKIVTKHYIKMTCLASKPKYNHIQHIKPSLVILRLNI